MAKTNHGRVGVALDLPNKGLMPYVECELKAVYKDQWQDKVQQLIKDDRGSEIDGGGHSFPVGKAGRKSFNYAGNSSHR